MKETSRFKLKYPEASENVSEGATNFATLAKGVDETNLGQQDYLHAGIVAPSSDWTFRATINETTASLSSEAATGGTAWLPDPVISGALMRTVTASAVITGEVSPVKPAEGKYVVTAYELVPSTWNGACTVKMHSGTEAASESAALAAAPATTAGRIQIRSVVINNTGGKYKIESQKDLRPNVRNAYFETGGNVGGIIEKSEQSVYTPANTLVTWRARIHGAASGGTEGGVIVQLKRAGGVVKEHSYRVCENNSFGSSVEVIDYVQAAAGTNTWSVVLTNFGTSFAATVDSGMLIFTA